MQLRIAPYPLEQKVYIWAIGKTSSVIRIVTYISEFSQEKYVIDIDFEEGLQLTLTNHLKYQVYLYFKDQLQRSKLFHLITSERTTWHSAEKIKIFIRNYWSTTIFWLFVCINLVLTTQFFFQKKLKKYHHK